MKGPDDDDADSSLAYEILRSLRRILRQVSAYSRALSRQSGLTVAQLLCLRAITEEGDAGRVTGALVSRKVQLSPPTVSRIVDRLEAAGFVRRERDAEDRRRVWLRLTTEGSRRLEVSPTPLQESFVGRIRALDEKDRAQLLAALEQVVEMMEAEDLDAAPLLAPEADLPRNPD